MRNFILGLVLGLTVAAGVAVAQQQQYPSNQILQSDILLNRILQQQQALKQEYDRLRRNPC